MIVDDLDTKYYRTVPGTVRQYFLLFAGLFSLQSIHALARDEWMEIAKKFIPPNTVLADPESIELYDFDQDGRNQIVATFQLQASEPLPAPNSERLH